MRKSLVLVSGVLLMLSMGSCVEDIDCSRAQGLLSVSQNGLTVIDAYNLGSLNSIDLSVAKGGLQDDGGTVTFNVDQGLLDSLNNADGTSYKMLPSDCYSFENATFNVPSGGDRHVVGGKLIYNPQKIANLSGFGKKEYAIALKATTTGTTLNTTRNSAIYVFNIKNAIVDFTSVSENITVEKDGTVKNKMPLNLQVGFENQWDLTASFSSKGAEYVENYNAANNTVYDLLPADSYTIADLTIAKGKKTADGEVKLKGTALAPGSYLLPISISALKGQGDTSIGYNSTSISHFFITKLGEKIDRADWTVTGNTEEAVGESNGNNGRFMHLIDGNKSTFWHSKWDGGKVPPPYRLTLDMGKVNGVMQLGLMARQDALAVMNIEIYAGKNETDGTLIGKYKFDGKNKEEQIFSVKACETQYICLYISSLASGDVGHMAEAYVYGVDK